MNFRFAPTLNNKLHFGNIRVLLFNKLMSDITKSDLILRIDYKHGLSDYVCKENEFYIMKICNDYLNIKFKRVIYQKDRRDIYNYYLESIPKEYKLILNNVLYLNLQHIYAKHKYIRYNDLVFGNMKKLSILVNSIPIYSFTEDIFFYNFTSVVDDIEQKITMVVRGSDHIDNTFLQIMIFMCLGSEDKIPKFCHIPLCFNQYGSKISKSSSINNLDLEDLIIKEFILPDTIFSYLTGYFADNNNININNIKISNKNKYINIESIRSTNINILKSMSTDILQQYLYKIKNLNVDTLTLKSIQPFIVCVDKFLNGVESILKIRSRNINFRELVINNSDKLSSKFTDYQNLNILFNTNLGNEIIKNVNYKFYNEVYSYILEYCK